MRMRIASVPLCLAGLLWTTASVLSAEIDVTDLPGTDRKLITITGRIDPDDGDKFKQKAGFVQKAVVAFKSDGGSLGAGLEIGTTIRLKNYWTAVLSGADCASACAFAWLGGTQRFMGAGSRIGFHAAYRMQGGKPSESGVGNALVGAYLANLGMSNSAVVYITQSAPTEMTWLTTDAASKIGIEVSVLPAWNQGPSAAKSPTISTPSQPPGSSGSAIASDIVGKLIDGRCRMDYCSYFSIESISAAGSNRIGELRQVETKHWSSHHPDGTYHIRARRTGGSQSTGYVFCSRQKPAVLFQSNGKWFGHLLPIGSDPAGFMTQSMIQYFAVCHGLIVKEADPFGTIGRRLGYSIPEGRAEQVELQDPRSILASR